MIDLKARRKVRAGDELIEKEQNKFARRRSLNNGDWLRPSDFEIGETMVIGQYVGTIESRKGIPYYRIMEESGTIKNVRANKSLTMAMDKVKINDWIEIVYNGMIILETGDWKGSQCHQFELYEVYAPDEDREELDETNKAEETEEEPKKSRKEENRKTAPSSFELETDEDGEMPWA